MRRIVLFAEDHAHEVILSGLLRRLGDKYATAFDLAVRSARGGYGAVLAELAEFVRDFQRDALQGADLLIISVDANCVGVNRRTTDVLGQIPDSYREYVVVAVADPHIERWLLLDSQAFKMILGKGCSAPAYKCARDHYKRLLIEAVFETGVTPLLGGVEYAEDLIAAMNLEAVSRLDPAFGRCIADLERFFKRWIAIGTP